MPNDYFDDVRTLLRNRYNRDPKVGVFYDANPDRKRSHAVDRHEVSRKLRDIARNAKRYNG